MDAVKYLRQNGQRLTIMAVKLENQRRQIQRREARAKAKDGAK